MGITTEELLAGPRGRRLCLALAVDLERASRPAPVGNAVGDESDATFTGPLEAAVWDVSIAFSAGTGGVGYFELADRRPSRRELWQAQRDLAARHQELRARPEAAVSRLVDALSDLAASTAAPAEPIDTLEPATGDTGNPTAPAGHRDPARLLDAEDLIGAVARSVDDSRGWQEPEGIDLALTLPESRAALLPFAHLASRHPNSAWWDREANLADQWLALRGNDHLEGLAAAAPAATQWADWLMDRQADESDGVRSMWWSTPALGELARTHGTFPPESGLPPERRLPTVAVWEEDSMGWGEGISAVRLVPDPNTRFLELRSALDWVRLCTEFPLEVAHSFGLSAREACGPDPVRGAGPWVIPDWSAVAREFDAVHLSVAGYLSTAGRLLEVPGLGATALFGWDPGETFWLGDVPPLAEPGGTLQKREWQVTEADVWRETTRPS